MFLISNLLWTQAPFLVLGTVIVAALGYRFFKPLFILSLLFFFFCLYFFRNPNRVCPAKDAFTIVCPADGRVMAITEDGQFKKVSIFLSVWDVHVQWSPIAGKITDITYHPGKFFKAYLPKSSLENEYNILTIEHESGQKIFVRQISGFIARRIVCWVKQGQNINACEKFGMIRFGSQVEITVPKSAELFVSLDERVWGGQSVLGKLEQT